MKSARSTLIAIFMVLLLCPSLLEAKRVKKKKPSTDQAPMFQLDDDRRQQIQDEIEKVKDKLGREKFADEKNKASSMSNLDMDGMQRIDTKAPDAPKFPMDIHDAVIDGDPLLVQVAVSEGGKDVNEVGQGGQTPIVHAILLGHDEVVEWLLFAGANLTIKEDQGFSPMHAAAHSGRERVVRMLAAFNMDPSERHRDGWTPIHYAAWGEGGEKHTETVRSLLELGVPHDEMTPHGHLPIQLAMEKKNQKSVDLLMEWQVKPPLDQGKVLGAIREQARNALAAKAQAHQHQQEQDAIKAREAGREL